MSFIFPVESTEEVVLREGPLDVGGAAAGGVLVEGVLGLETADAAAPRKDGAGGRGVQEEVRPAELLGRLQR